MSARGLARRARLALLIAPLLLVPRSSEGQTGSLAGRVLDATSGRPIAGAEVFVVGTESRAVTEQNGSYLLEGLLVGPRRVGVRRLGYGGTAADVTIVAETTGTFDLALHVEPLRLDDLVVTGTPLPRGTRRRAIGNAVTTIPVADIQQDMPATTFQELVSGRVPGLRFTRLSGNLGTGSPLTLRGVGTFDLGRSQPLVYVDGVRVSTDVAAGPPIGSGRSVNVLDDFGLEEIETIEIIQGAAAGSLYGSDAASGIIHLITPKGQLGPPEFTAFVRQGVNYLADPAGRIGPQYFCATQPLPNPGVGTACTAEHLGTYNMYDMASRYIADGYFAWPTPELFSNGPSQSYGLSVRGGTPSTRYFLSAGYDDEQGMTAQNTDETVRLRANVGVTLNERFTADFSTGYVTGRTSFLDPAPGNGGIWQDLVWSNGYYLNSVTPFGSPGNCAGSICDPDPRRGGFEQHLPTDVAQVEATRDYTRFTGSATVTFGSPTFDVGSLSVAIRSRAIVGTDKAWDINRNVFPRNGGDVPAGLAAYCAPLTCVPTFWFSTYDETVRGVLNYERPVATSTTAELGVTFDVAVGPSFGTATSAGVQYYVQERELFANWGEGLASPASRAINHLSQRSINTVYNSVESKSIGFYVQEEVAIADRIFLTGALRQDDNSSFGDQVSPRLYPKAAVAWLVSEESFWGLDAIESLRIRGAWGKAGRPPAALAGRSTYIALQGLAEALAVRPGSVGNPQIEPEVATELELGFDVAALDGRVAASFTRHRRRNDGAILEVNVPSTFGLLAPMAQNLGRIDTWGWEAQLHARLYEGRSMSFVLGLGADHVDNEIVELGIFPANPSLALGLPFPNQLNDDLVTSATWDPAGPVITVFGQRVSAMCDQGVSLAPDPSAPDAARYGRVKGGNAVPCPTIPNRFVVMGRAFATHTFSVAPRLGLFDDRLQLFAVAEGQYGRLREANDREYSHVYANTRISRLQDDPAWVYGYAVGDDTKRSLYDADFWKLREVGLRLTVPSAFTRALGAERASLSFSARNLWTIWRAQPDIYGVPITDPEFGAPSLDGDANFYETPPITNVSLTLRVTF